MKEKHNTVLKNSLKDTANGFRKKRNYLIGKGKKAIKSGGKTLATYTFRRNGTYNKKRKTP